MVGLYGQMEVVKVNGTDGRSSGTDSALLKISDHDNVRVGYSIERSSPSFSTSMRCRRPPLVSVQRPIITTLSLP
jgi:hypothetical protein